jgi:hypothetical protein
LERCMVSGFCKLTPRMSEIYVRFLSFEQSVIRFQRAVMPWPIQPEPI